MPIKLCNLKRRDIRNFKSNILSQNLFNLKRKANPLKRSGKTKVKAALVLKIRPMQIKMGATGVEKVAIFKGIALDISNG